MRPRGIAVKGLVQDDRDLEPVAGASVLLNDREEDANIVGITNTDAQGRFELALPPGLPNEAPPVSKSLWFRVTTAQGKTIFSTKRTTMILREPSWRVILTIPHQALAQVAAPRPTVRVGSFDLDGQALEELRQEDILNLARLIAHKEVPKDFPERIKRLNPDLLPEKTLQTRCSLTPLLRTIQDIIRHKQWPEDFTRKVWEHQAAPANQANPHVHEGANFVITYYLKGQDPAGVDPDTSSQQVTEPGDGAVVLTTLPAGGPPTYVKRLCFWLERALSTYTSPPFRLKNPAAAGKIPVSVLDVDLGGVISSGLVIDNNLPADLMATIIAHEVFHLVQEKYVSLYAGPWGEAFLEGSAVVAENALVDRINRYLFEASTTWGGAYGALVHPNQPLLLMAHDSGFFWRYFTEQHSPNLTSPLVGVETFRTVLEECERVGSCTLDAIRQGIAALPWYQGFFQFDYLDPGKVDLLSAETTLGNYALACKLKDLGARVPDGRFDFIESKDDILWDDVYNSHDIHNLCPEIDSLAQVKITRSELLTPGLSISYNGFVERFASEYHVVTIDRMVSNVDVDFSGEDGTIFQIALVEEDGTVRDIHRSDRGNYSKRFVHFRDGKPVWALLVVTGCQIGGNYSISVNPAPPSPDVMVTRWNTRRRKEYEIDSSQWSWTWVSPDVWVDNDGDGSADDVVHLNQDNRLCVQLHNKGNADASGVAVDFFYQDAAGTLSPTGWLPVEDPSGVVQALTGLSLRAGQSHTWSVNWCPRPSGSSRHFCVRVVVTVPGDPNTDNKRAISNFGNVVLTPGGFAELAALRRNTGDTPVSVESRVITRLPAGLDVSRPDGVEDTAVDLAPGEAVMDRVLVAHTDRREDYEASVADSVSGAGVVQTWSRKFNIPEDALPPGVAGKPLVTLVHRVNGVVAGGVTFQVVPERKA